MDLIEIINMFKQEIAIQLTHERVEYCGCPPDGSQCSCKFRPLSRLSINNIIKDLSDPIHEEAVKCLEEYGENVSNDLIRDHICVWQQPLVIVIGDEIYPRKEW